MTTVVPYVRVIVCGLLLCTLSACRQTIAPQPVNWDHELRDGQVALRKIPASQYPDFSAAFVGSNIRGVSQAIDHSLSYLSRPSSQRYFPYLDINHDRAVASLVALKQVMDNRNLTPAERNRQIHEQFEVYQSVGGWDPNAGRYTNRVLFTGYFTPIYDASLTRSDEYRFPLYKRPTDLVSDSDGQVQGRHTPDGRIVPYYTHQQIVSQNVLAGNELVWLNSRWAAYVIVVQGSARLRLRDGQIMEVGYAGNNGYEYTSPARQMVRDGVIAANEVNATHLKELFEGNPQLADKYLFMNERYVFFAPSSGGPYGSINVPVTPWASVATDKSIFPRAMPVFVDTLVPSTSGTVPQSFRAFMLDQDTGGGIRAAGRADLYMGVGPEVERLAGHQLHEGSLYYLAVKPELVPKYLPKQPAAKPSASETTVP